MITFKYITHMLIIGLSKLMNKELPWKSNVKMLKEH